MADEGTKGHFCVIAPFVDGQGVKRTWRATQEEAAKHGIKLIERSCDRNGIKTKRLLVVKVVEVLEVPPSVIVTRREPKADDLTVEAEEGD